MSGDLEIRPAQVDDLPTIFRVALLADGQSPDEVLAGLPADVTISSHRHGQAHGEMLLAVDDGEIIGFATIAQRDGTRFLAQLFVLPDRQSAGVGLRLMKRAFDGWDGPRGCVASDDNRALALYIRFGMAPQWPLLALRGPLEALADVAGTDYDVVEAKPDERFFRMDAKISGRYRPQEHEYLQHEHAGTPLWILRDGVEIGYAYLLEFTKGRDGHWWEPGSVGIRPLGVIHQSHAWPALAAVAKYAGSRGTTLHAEVPGLHPVLPELLARGFRFDEPPGFVLLSDADRFGDPTRYLPSGGTWY